MAYINAATSGNFVRLLITTTISGSLDQADFITSGVPSAGVLDVPALQDINLTNAPATFRWRQLDSLSENVVTTVSTNTVAGNLVLDPATFFGTTGPAGTTAAALGLFNLANNKTLIYFMICMNGTSSTDRAFLGQGYITNLAPSVSADSPVFVSSFTIEVDGNFTPVTLT